MILIDLQKTFDTLDHTILLNKMKCIGFDKWLSVHLQTKWFWVRVPLQSLNKCICFCLKRNSRHHIGAKDFQEINCLPTKKKSRATLRHRRF